MNLGREKVLEAREHTMGPYYFWDRAHDWDWVKIDHGRINACNVCGGIAGADHEHDQTFHVLLRIAQALERMVEQ